MANDHYVPQFYLRNFAISGRAGWVYTYRRNIPTKPLGIKRGASEENFDLIQNDIPFMEKDYVAKILKKTEDEASPIINKLVGGSDLNLSEKEYAALAMFLAYLMHRNPTSREKISNIHIEIQKAEIKAIAESKTGFAQYAKKKGLKDDPDAIENYGRKSLTLMTISKLYPKAQLIKIIFFL